MTRLTKQVFLVATFFILILLNACSKLGNAGSAAGSSATATPTPTPTPLLTATLSQAFDDNSSVFNTAGSCTVPSTTATGANVDCTMNVPEGTLNYSRLKWGVEVPAGACEHFEFHPYYYRESNNAAFTPLWGTAPVDCSAAAPTSSDCYNGMAPNIVPLFPAFDYFYSSLQSAAYSYQYTPTTMSPNEAQNKRGKNRQFTSALSVASRSANQFIVAGDEYLANTMQDYRFDCRDAYQEIVFQLTIVLGDVDSTIDHFDDWANY